MLLSLASGFGGLYKLIMGLTFNIYMLKYNKKHIMAKFIRGLYYTQIPKETKLKLFGMSTTLVQKDAMSFDISDELVHLKRSLLPWRKDEPDETFYTKSE